MRVLNAALSAWLTRPNSNRDFSTHHSSLTLLQNSTRHTAIFTNNNNIIIIFQPIAVETLGPINESARAFLDDLGRRISALSGDDREHLFLFQRISIAIQRFNAVLLHEGFLSEDHPDSFFHFKPLCTFLNFFPPSFLRGFKIIKNNNNNIHILHCHIIIILMVIIIYFIYNGIVHKVHE